MENSRGPPRKWSHVVGISRDPTNAAPRLRAEVATGRWRTPTASRTRSSDTAKSHEPTGRPDPIPRPGSAVVTLPVIGYTDHCADGGQLFGVHRRRRIVGSVTPTIDATSTLTWWWLVKRPHQPPLRGTHEASRAPGFTTLSLASPQAARQPLRKLPIAEAEGWASSLTAEQPKHCQNATIEVR